MIFGDKTCGRTSGDEVNLVSVVVGLIFGVELIVRPFGGDGDTWATCGYGPRILGKFG